MQLCYLHDKHDNITDELQDLVTNTNFNCFVLLILNSIYVRKDDFYYTVVLFFLLYMATDQTCFVFFKGKKQYIN